MEYLKYHERERQKHKARAVLNDPEANLFKKSRALLLVIEAHYWRAREHLEAWSKSAQRRVHGKRYCPGYQLDIDVYTRHWLFTNGDSEDQEVVTYLREQCGYYPEPSRFLPKGRTSYTMTATGKFPKRCRFVQIYPRGKKRRRRHYVTCLGCGNGARKWKHVQHRRNCPSHFLRMVEESHKRFGKDGG